MFKKQFNVSKLTQIRIYLSKLLLFLRKLQDRQPPRRHNGHSARSEWDKSVVPTQVRSNQRQNHCACLFCS